MKSKLVYNVTRYALAVLFLFSGFTKGVNPFGLSIQFDEYFTALGLPFLAVLSPLCAIVLPALEMLVGWFLLFGLAERLTRWAVVVFMGFFTLLTLWIAIFNPVNDCGCFGDVIKISNWATFFKNLVFSAAAALFFVQRSSQRKVRWIYVLALSIVSLALPVYCYFNLPLIDSTPYARGKNIAEQMQSTLDEQSTARLVYRDKQSGGERTFEVSDTTWQDEARWEYVRTEVNTTSTGREAAIKSLVLMHSTLNVDIAQELFSMPGHTFLFVVPDPSLLSDGARAWFEEVATDAKRRSVSCAFLTSDDKAKPIADLVPILVDRSTAHTMVQNRVGGIILLLDGTVIDKWAF